MEKRDRKKRRGGITDVAAGFPQYRYSINILHILNVFITERRKADSNSNLHIYYLLIIIISNCDYHSFCFFIGNRLLLIGALSFFLLNPARASHQPPAPACAYSI